MNEHRTQPIRMVRVLTGGLVVAWREAGPPSHLDDKVDSDQQVVNKELSLY